MSSVIVPSGASSGGVSPIAPRAPFSNNRAAKRVLLVEINEDGTVGGSHQALFDLATHADRSAFEPIVLFYEENRFAEILRERGFEVHTWKSARDVERTRRYSTGVRGQFNTGWSVLGAIRRRFRFLRDERVDLVHLNNSPCIGFSD